jgi:hypothetical protein
VSWLLALNPKSIAAPVVFGKIVRDSIAVRPVAVFARLAHSAKVKDNCEVAVGKLGAINAAFTPLNCMEVPN